MVKNWKFILIIFLTINKYHQIINAAKQSLVDLIKPTHYTIYLHLNPNKDHYYGVVNITYVALQTFQELIVDGILDNMQLLEPKDDDAIIDRRDKKCHNIKFTRNHMINETYTIKINFQNSLSKSFYGVYRHNSIESSFIATQFEPTYARHGFPCFDHPAMKAEFELIIDRPSEFKSLSNMPLASTVPSQTVHGRHIDHFQKTVKMSPYLLAFCVSKFDNLTDGNLSIWTRTVPNNMYNHLQFSITILKFFEIYFDFKYNLPKLDVVAAPVAFFSGMENWGLIIIREINLINNDEKSYKEKIHTKMLLTHEITHQWIGNVVTHEWWDYIWLIEGLTTYFEYIGIDGIMPQLKIWNTYAMEVLQFCFEVDVTDDDFHFKLQKKLPDDVVSKETAFSTFMYRKGCAIIRMFVDVASAHAFQELMRDIIKKYAFSTITVENFFEMLGDTIKKYYYYESNNINYVDRMISWTTSIGYPLVTVNVSRNPYIATTFHQKRYGDELNENNSIKYWIPISYTTTGYIHINEAKSILWMSNETEIVQNDRIVLRKNEFLLINLNQTGYYRVNYDNENWNAIINYLNNENTFSNIPIANRIQLMDDAIELASKSIINVTIPLNLMKYIKHEIEFEPWQVAGKYFEMLLDVMRYKPQYDYLKNFIYKSIAKVYMHLDFTNGEDVNEHRGWQRIYILRLACTIGHKQCVEKSMTLFRIRYDQLIHNVFDIKLNFIEINHREFIYCTAMKNVDDRKWNFIHGKLNLLGSEKETEMFATALTCTRNPALLEKYLYEYFVQAEPIVSETIIKKESIMRLICRNPIGYDVLYNFLWAFVKEIKLRWGIVELLFILDVPIKYIYHEHQLKSYEKLLRYYFNENVPSLLDVDLTDKEYGMRSFSNDLIHIENFLNTYK